MTNNHLKELTPLFNVRAAKFSIQFEPEETWRLSGTEKALRGRLGFDLKRMCCTFPGFRQRVCSECAMLRECLYIRLFAPVSESPEIRRNGKKNPSAPAIRPFVMHSDGPKGKNILEPGQTGNLESVLLGPAIQYCSLFIEATVSALHHFHLSAKEIKLMAPISTGSGKMASESGDGNLSWSLAEWCRDEQDNGHSFDVLKLGFLTPLHIRDRGRTVLGDLSFSVLIKSLVRRLRDLKRAFESDTDMGKTDREFFEMAEAVKVTGNSLYWSRRKRYSYRQKQDVFLNGFKGDISFSGPFHPFIPLLKAGEIIHVGKDTSCGGGRIKIL